MSHHCQALILHCMDFRLSGAIKEYMAQNGLINNCDVVSLAGAAKNIVSPLSESDADLTLRQIDISKRLHNISEVILMNHTDCGAYGGRAAFASDEEEARQHLADMDLAAEKIVAKFPELKVRIVLAKIDPEGKISFEERGYFSLPSA
ncbi:MAG: carbonic anhydrase [Candidatus Liptonbacteria bacterium]